MVDSEVKFTKETGTKDNIVSTSFVKNVGSMGINKGVAIELRTGKIC